jgi:hypothetical protein
MCRQALVVETALSLYLSPDNSERMEAALGRRLDRWTRRVERLERHITISNKPWRCTRRMPRLRRFSLSGVTDYPHGNRSRP